MKIKQFEIIDRCLFWKEKEMLVIGDLHLGYEGALNENGIAIPKSQVEETKVILTNIFKKTGKVKEIVLLGDLKHYFSRILRQEFNDLKEIIIFLKENLKESGKIIVIKGNHDKILTPITSLFNYITIKDFYLVDNVEFFHGDLLEFKSVRPFSFDKNIDLLILGHFHPAITLREGAKQEKYKCFLEGYSKELDKKIIIVPSFFPLIEGSDIIQDIKLKICILNFRIIALDEEGDIYDFGKVKSLKNN